MTSNRGVVAAESRVNVRGRPLDLDRLKARDESAWTEAFQQLWAVAYGAARHPSASLTTSESEEAASEALAQLVSHIAEVGTIEQLKALTATIGFRKAISLARKKSASKRGLPGLSLDGRGSVEESFGLPWSGGEKRLSDVETAEMVLLLQEVLSELDPQTHRLLEEKHILGSTYEELSASHGIPLGTACAKVARGLQKVRQRLLESPRLAKELRAFLR